MTNIFIDDQKNGPVVFTEDIHTYPCDMSPGATMFHDIMKEMNDDKELIHVL